MPSVPLSITNLKSWQDSLIENAKKLLQKDGALAPISFILTLAMNVDEELKHHMRIADTDLRQSPTLASSNNVQPNDPVIMIISGLAALRYVQDICNVEVPEHVHEADLITMAVKHLINRTDAIACVSFYETWTLEGKNKLESHGDLSKHPDSTESITSILETDTVSRLVSTGFYRNRPKVGRIIGFNEPREHIDGEGDSELTGRKVHLFRKAKAIDIPPSPYVN